MGHAPIALRLEEHVLELADRHGVEVRDRHRKTGRGHANRRDRYVRVGLVTGPVSYLVALHELGHVLGENPKLRLSQEAAAWRWALDNSLIDPSPAAYRSILRRLRSYEERARRRRRMVTPPDFVELLELVAQRAEA